jgi:Zn-dependent protease
MLDLFAQLGTPAGVTLLALIVLSLTFHEAAHAFAAYRLGDPTAKRLGRLTLNPLPHIDPVMTIIVPTVLAMTTGYIFGGAKPVPVDPRNFRAPHRHNAFVAAAGPLSNIALALVGVLVLQILSVTGAYQGKVLAHLVYWFTYFNILLAIFNSIPIPPLDGSRIVSWLLPGKLRMTYGSIERYGVLALVVLLLLFREHIGPPLHGAIREVMGWLYFIVTLGGSW